MNRSLSYGSYISLFCGSALQQLFWFLFTFLSLTFWVSIVRSIARAELSVIGTVVLGAPLLLCLTAAIFFIYRSFRIAITLKSGLVCIGHLQTTRPTNLFLWGRPVFRLRFQFPVSPHSHAHVESTTLHPAAISDTAVIIYRANAPRTAVVLSCQPGMLQYDATHRVITTSNPLVPLMLLLPLSTLVSNVTGLWMAFHLR
jgi:hypothetical protein